MFSEEHHDAFNRGFNGQGLPPYASLTSGWMYAWGQDTRKQWDEMFERAFSQMSPAATAVIGAIILCVICCALYQDYAPQVISFKFAPMLTAGGLAICYATFRIVKLLSGGTGGYKFVAPLPPLALTILSTATSVYAIPPTEHWGGVLYLAYGFIAAAAAIAIALYAMASGLLQVAVRIFRFQQDSMRYALSGLVKVAVGFCLAAMAWAFVGPRLELFDSKKRAADHALYLTSKRTATIIPSLLALRMEPDEDAVVIANFPRGTRVRIVRAEANGWELVDVLTNLTPEQTIRKSAHGIFWGYMAGKYLQPLP